MTSSAGAPAASIALLPLANASGDPEKDYFADGLTAQLHSALTGVRALRVASRGAAAALQSQMALSDLARELGVATVLEGSVTRLGGQLRIAVRLIAAADGTTVWSEHIDRKYDEVFAVLREITDRILTTLQAAPTAEERPALDHVPTRDLRALDPYLRARHVSGQIRRVSQNYALQMYGDAVKTDQGFALAHAGLAESHALLFTYWESSDDHLRLAEAAGARAVALAPELAETHMANAVALSLNKRHDDAEVEFQAALRLKPNLSEAHYHYARHCRTRGRFEEAARWFESSSALRPEDYSIPALLSSVYVGMGRAEEARAAQQRSLALSERRLKLVPDDERALYLGAGSLSSLGDSSRAREWAKRAVAMEPDDSAVLYNVACVYALLGLKDSAIDCLENAVKNGFGHWEWIEHDSDFDSLLSHPRFQALVKR
ncbi:MAG TPA: tetratricopeptide repeat protein [Gemmatimonadales bacterium]